MENNANSGAMERLQQMAGLDNIKKQFEWYRDVFKCYRDGKIPGKFHQHMAFMGNPGTGKTTVARLFAEILHEDGLLTKGQFVGVSPIDLISPYVGQTISQTQAVCDRAKGGVLFIDEAYGLMNDFGKEAIEVLIQFMMNNDDTVVILAGYTKEMKQFLDYTGIGRHFIADPFHFEDYTNEELWEMLKRKTNAPDSEFSMDEQACEEKALQYFASLERGPHFGNARIVEILLSHLILEQGKRFAKATPEQRKEPDFAKRILPEDFPQDRINAGMSDVEILKELNDLIGLQKAKDTIADIINNVRSQQLLSDAGQARGSRVGLNFVFRGNLGTGKTTVARLLGNVLANHGLISDPEVVTYTKGQLMDRYVGSGPRNVEKMFEDSVGKVLFIDEAYQLADHDSRDVLNALTNMMTDERFKDRMAVILAGYHGQMSELINSNPGLHSRFTQYVDFDDYSNDELTEIFRKKLESEDFVIGEEALAHARAYFSSLSRNINFGNAREAMNLKEKVLTKHGKRINASMTKEELFTILPEDFPNNGRTNADAFMPKQGVAPTPMDKLNRLSGMDAIREQFVKYLRMFHYCKEHPQDEISHTFRPHMAFMGNPGTGKTTVARLFGEILREEGLLTSNNFVEVGPADLVGEYVGQSASKARRQFERAKGGILFIDEAYVLNMRGGNQFGQEVLTALVQFMEDVRDTIVIMAGYTDELRHLIRYGNSGLGSRVTNEFVFEDYQPDILFEILLKKLGSHETTQQFKDDMRQIIQYEFAHRDERRWGNARAMENHANAIFRNYLLLHNAEGPIDSDCIPDNLRQYLPLISAPQGNSTSTTTASQPTVPSASLSIDLTTNPADRRVTDGRQLRKQATGLLTSSNGEGTGVIISIPDRYILTCCHVVEEAGPDILFKMNSNREFETTAHVLWQDFEQDMALLQLDEIPDDACYVQIDSDIDHNPDPSDPEEKTKLVLCSYTIGSNVASAPSLTEGKISHYEKQRQWNRRCFDTILISINATHGCSGGPAVRESDFMLVGLLQGGMAGSNIQLITDIHQLFRHKNLIIKCKKTEIVKSSNKMENKANSSAIERLQQMAGLDNIKKQFERYRDAFKRHRDGKTPGNFHQHMAFMGNPGTGKTTVARLFAEILHEDGLLPQGQFVEAKVDDLVGQYIGETRVKAAALCDRAKGGVLFIDEAYALMSGANDNGNVDFGKEAIEVLIQFMMNNDDTVVIFAGYTDEMKRFINECNPGFRSHLFNDSLSFFYFEDYEPDVLYQIAKKNIPEEIETTPAFDKALHDIVVLKHAFRSKIFGNARAMENMVATIVSSYYDSGDDGPLDVRHLPDKLRVLVDPAMYDEKVMLAELNQKIVGQQQIKHFVRHLYLSHLAERTMMSNIEGYKPKLLRLNFIFAGNPGTGKTTVARIIGNLLQKMGVLSSNDDTVLTEVLGGDVANMSPAQIQDLFEDNIGKVLLIDEAYMLAENTQALTEILSNATNSDYRGKLCLILAGYTTEMHQMMRLNPGMPSRFEEILFEDYTNEELWEMLKRKINAPDSELLMDEASCKKTAINYFAAQPRGPHFGNARIVEILLSQLKLNLSKRYLKATNEQKADPDFARRILPEDFPQRTAKKQLKEELMLLANELQEKLQQLQSKLNELSEE